MWGFFISHCKKITIVFLEISLALAKHFVPVIISLPVKIDSKKKNKKKIK
jgi:hypothetical protein